MNHFTHALAKRNIRIMFWVTLFGSVNFLEPILTLFYLARGLEQSDVFGLTIAWSLTILICEVPTGLFADRFGPKASFITGGLIAIASKLCLLFAHDVWMFYLYSMLLGLYVTFFSGAEEALIYNPVSAKATLKKWRKQASDFTSGAFCCYTKDGSIVGWLVENKEMS